MKKAIREIKGDIVQITTYDERWYTKSTKDKKTNLPIYLFIPSVTWKAEYYPKGIGFYKWLAEKGWDEAEAIKIAAGDKGSKVHYAVQDLLTGNEVRMDSKYINPTTEQEEELTVQEYEGIMSFAAWFKEVKPEVLAVELTAFNDEENYAGTIDYIFRIKGQIWIIDGKTSPNIWPSHELQVSAYSHMDIATNKDLAITVDEWRKRKLGILQLGYRKNKKGYKFTEIEDKFDLFLHASAIWANECEKIEPKQRDYPMTIKLEI